MNPRYSHVESMTPDEKFKAVASLKDKLEDNYIALGQLFSEIKRTKIFRFKGYENFKDFIEAEYNFNNALAGKLSQIFELYIDEMDMDEETIKAIGMDRLQMIRPFVAKAPWETREQWTEKAQDMPANELRNHIKDLRTKQREADKDMKEIITEQHMERMLAWFNCSRKELNFKLALFFQDADLNAISKVIKERQRQFESQTQAFKEETR